MKFEEFLSTCAVMLEGENPLLVSFIKKRYDNCSESFRTSAEMNTLLETTSHKMRTDHQRLFVHLKNFVTELKNQAAVGKQTAKLCGKRKANSPLQAVAKLSRVEDSHSEGSDLEGLLRTHQPQVLSSASQTEPAPVPSQNSVAGSQTAAKTPECPAKANDTVCTTVLPSVRKETVHTSLSSEGIDSAHTSPAFTENKQGITSVSLPGKELNHTSSSSGHMLLSPVKQEVGSAVNGLGSVTCVGGTARQSCSQSPAQCPSRSAAENGPLAPGSSVNFLPNYKPSTAGIFPASTSCSSDSRKDSFKTNINGNSLGELQSSGRECNLNTVHSEPEGGHSNPPRISDKPEVPTSESKRRVKPVQLTSGKSKEISATQVLFSSSTSSSFSSKVSSPTPINSYGTLLQRGQAQAQSSFLSSSSAPLASGPPFKMSCDGDKDDLILIDSNDNDEEEQQKPAVKCSRDVLTHTAALGDTADNHRRLSQPSTASALTTGFPVSASSCSATKEAFEPQDALPNTHSKEAKHVKKYENLLEKIRNKIEKVREKEMSLEDLDAEDSSYIFEDRLQKKFIKVWNKLCSLKGCTTSSGRPVEKRFKFEGTRYPEINRKVQKFVNRPDSFPDYHDIKGIVKKVSTRCKLGLNAQQINEISKEAFLDVGEALQKRRHLDFISTFHNRQTMTFSSDRDPALFDDDLRRKLDENRRIGKSRLDEVISKYSNLQMELAAAGKADSAATDAEESDKPDTDGEEGQDSLKAKVRVATRMQAGNIGNSLMSDGDDLGDDYDTSAMIEMDIAEESHLLLESCPGGSYSEESPATWTGFDAQDADSDPQDFGGHRGMSRVNVPKEFTEKQTAGKKDHSSKDELKPYSPVKYSKDSKTGYGKQSPHVKVNGDTVGQKVQKDVTTDCTPVQKDVTTDCSPSRAHSLQPVNLASKSRSPVMVKTSLKLPKFLFRNNGTHSGSKPDSLFYPDKIQGTVSSEEKEDGFTIIGSSDEETGRVVVKKEPYVKKEVEDCNWPRRNSVIVLSDSD